MLDDVHAIDVSNSLMVLASLAESHFLNTRVATVRFWESGPGKAAKLLQGS